MNIRIRLFMVLPTKTEKLTRELGSAVSLRGVSSVAGAY